MTRITLPSSLILLSTFNTFCSATFNLNISGPDWDYTASDLSNTTSSACKTAYGALINCDPTLLGLVASMRPAFDPQPSDFDNMCVPACNSSLVAYVHGVQEACTADGDKAQESPGGADWEDYILDPVAIVGQLFQYTYASECAKLSNGTYCHFIALANADSFSCDDQCAIDFYQTAHDFPASSKEFNYYWLISRGSWWATEFETGWERLVSCGKAVGGGNSSESAASTTVAAPVSTKTETAAPATTTGSTPSAGKGTSTSTSSSASSTSTGVSSTKSNFGDSLKVERFSFLGFSSLLCVLFFV